MFSTIANSYKKKKYNKNLFFVIVHDNEETHRICQLVLNYFKLNKLKNNFPFIPIIVYYSPNGDGNLKSKHEIYDIRTLIFYKFEFDLVKILL